MAIVGLDVGTPGITGVALDAEGAMIARAGREHGLGTPRPQRPRRPGRRTLRERKDLP